MRFIVYDETERRIDMYSAKEAAEITGLSTATLRYYEKEKLLPPIARNSQKYRQLEKKFDNMKVAISDSKFLHI